MFYRVWTDAQSDGSSDTSEYFYFDSLARAWEHIRDYNHDYQYPDGYWSWASTGNVESLPNNDNAR